MSTVVAGEGLEGKADGDGTLLREVAQHLGQRGTRAHAGHHRIDDLWPCGTNGLGVGTHPGDDPGVGEERHAERHNEGDRPCAGNNEDEHRDDRPDRTAQHDEAPCRQPRNACARNVLTHALPRPPRPPHGRGEEPRGQGHNDPDPEYEPTHNGDHSVPHSSRDARSNPAAAKRSCRSSPPLPRSQRIPSYVKSDAVSIRSPSTRPGTARISATWRCPSAPRST